MHKKYRNNILEQNRGLILQISIIISLLAVLAAFNYKSKNSAIFTGEFVEVTLSADTFEIQTNTVSKPLPEKIIRYSEFTGGENALKQYIRANLHYPKKALEKNIQGRVYVKFTVNRYGKIKNPGIVRSIHPLIDNEAVRLIKNMPDWQPAKTKNSSVESEQILPVIFMIK